MARHRRVNVPSPLQAVLLRVGLYRMISLIGGAFASTVILSVLIAKYGDEGYATYTVLATLLVLLPFADLGLGVAVVNCAADYRAGDMSAVALAQVTRRVLFILSLIGSGIIVLSAILYLMGTWSELMGSAAGNGDFEIMASVVLGVLGLALPLGLGARLLQGLGHMDLVTRTAVLGPIVQIAVLCPLVVFANTAVHFTLIPALSYLAVAAVTFARACRKCPKDVIRLAISNPVKVRNSRPLASVAMPFLLISIGLSVAFQAQRIILSHVSSLDEVARYALVAQYLVPLLSIATVAAQALWPEYRMHREKYRIKSFKIHIAMFVLVGLLLSATLAIAVLGVSRIVLDGEIRIEPELIAAASAYLVVMCAHQPAAMYLSDERGLRAQASLVIGMSLTSAVLTVVLGRTFGAAGAFLAILLSVAVIQMVPTMLIARRKIIANTIDSAETVPIAVQTKEQV